jgi:hypothetical protein
VQLLGTDWTPDDDSLANAEGESEGDVSVGSFERAVWNVICRAGARLTILHMAEVGLTWQQIELYVGSLVLLDPIDGPRLSQPLAVIDLSEACWQDAGVLSA